MILTLDICARALGQCTQGLIPINLQMHFNPDAIAKRANELNVVGDMGVDFLRGQNVGELQQQNGKASEQVAWFHAVNAADFRESMQGEW